MIATASLVLALCLFAPPQTAPSVEPQPLKAGVPDNGVNILLDSSHQFSFFHHWPCQDALRDAGFRVTGSQASLDRALKQGSPMRVRTQVSHAWDIERPFTAIPAPRFDVLFSYQHGAFQPYPAPERAAIRAFLEAGGGAVFDVSSPDAPAAEILRGYGAVIGGRTGEASIRIKEKAFGLAAADLPKDLRQADLGPEWTVAAGAGDRLGAVAWRKAGPGTIVLISDPRLIRVKDKTGERVNGTLLRWAVLKASGGPRRKTDERRVPWEPEGLGGAFYPDNEFEVGGLRVLASDNQLPSIIELARTRFTEVAAVLQKMLPTPPNPGRVYYINLAAGEGGGWAENAITPKMAGTISMKPEAILSILAHELAHTMYGPEAVDGTPGCLMPGWWSEAHAGWFQRKAGREMGFGDRWPYYSKALAVRDPLLAVDLAADLTPEATRLAWDKAWLIWSILDARYGPDWYPKWLAHVHKTYNDPKRPLTMDEYVLTVSESVGEDTAPLFERFGTTVGPAGRTNLPPIGPKK
ncbi:MAG: hypothetical protein PHI34_02505 [Acidobacteriota bacterium]|nr:hypothetical protein [Acidobacteriota bacterium]